jgi:predicted permease
MLAVPASSGRRPLPACTWVGAAAGCCGPREGDHPITAAVEDTWGSADRGGLRETIVLDRLAWDLRLAVRWLRRAPGFTLLAAASLAIGIGFNTAIFSAVDALLLRPLPVAAPDRLADVYTSARDGDVYSTSSYPDYLDFRARNAVFDDMIGYSPMFGPLNLGDRSRLVLGEVVTGNYFRVLGVEAALGRPLLPEDDRPGADRVVVVSDRFWRRELGASRDIIGRTIRLRGQPYAIVGVAPRRFNGLFPMLAPEIWLPVAQVGEVEPAGIQEVVPSPGGTSRLDRRGQRWMFLKGRLKPGVTPPQAEANLRVVMDHLAAAYPETNKDRVVTVLPTSAVRIHPSATRVLVPMAAGLMVVVGLVLLVACANVASMLLARASARRREIGIRLAIGASRTRLVRQLLAESLALSALGAVGGVALAWWLTGVVATLSLPLPVPLSVDLRLDGRVLAFTLAVTIIAGVLAGLAPAVRSLRRDLVADLRGDAPAAPGRRWGLRDALVAAQIAVTMVLLVGAALLGRSLVNAHRIDVGFDTGGLAVVSFDLDMVRYDEARAEAFFDRALARIRALPGVTAAAVAERLPLSITFNVQQVYVPGHHQPADQPANIEVTRVSPDYFETLGIPILAGRAFTRFDTPDTPGVVVVNETMARRFWPGETPLGRRIHLRGPDGPAFEVVGVAADHKVRSLGEARAPYMHFARTQRPAPYGAIVARTRGHAGALLADMRRTLLEMEPNLVFVDNQTMDAQVAATLLPVRAAAWIVTLVGAVALLLAAVGLYGVIAYSVSRRTREIGIRMALGARASSVVALVMRQGLALATAGLVAGALLAALASRAMTALLYGVGTGDPVAWSLAALVVLGAAALANLVPAWRAASVEPSVALRVE